MYPGDTIKQHETPYILFNQVSDTSKWHSGDAMYLDRRGYWEQGDMTTGYFIYDNTESENLIYRLFE